MLGFAEFAGQTEKWFGELADRGSSVIMDGDGRTFYGRFHTYSRRTDERWRICVDYDTDERSATLDEEFHAAIDVDDVEAFHEVTRV
ncbi:hypothetical protein [Lentzea albidocapillata]|uniref:Uncharacterized protein n=1 Tax=Lentzea albidocapillata TaxID=40571 RepID=A0A1W2EWZ5_9PSEU|nr:hypothetical protein [Lentzea albidocapillata]SMD14201.1 hypothetical protein SAMN05660733_04636 [Lentzea albidocapillata]